MNSDRIRAAALAIGFHKVGIASVDGIEDDAAITHLKNWLALGYHADMAWMANPKRQDIHRCMTDVRSLISVAVNYYTPHQRANNLEIAKISRYGWGRDYHKVMEKKLKALSNWLQEQGEDIKLARSFAEETSAGSLVKTRYYADTGPIQDKVWAQRAGLGWIGKNGNVITRDYGSWVFLGEILTNLELAPDKPHTEHCGTCTRCLDACPTNAISKPFVVDANLCIAYHTIENREPELPEAIAKKLSGWVAGCDICQDVCPWNQRFAQETDIEDFQPYPQNINPKLTELATIKPTEWDHRFRASALRRIKPQMWQRNAKANLKYIKDQ